MEGSNCTVVLFLGVQGVLRDSSCCTLGLIAQAPELPVCHTLTNEQTFLVVPQSEAFREACSTYLPQDWITQYVESRTV